MSDAPRKRLPIRWLTLGEFVGVAALVIAALGYWDAHRERAAEAKAQQAQAAEMALKQTFLMTGAVDGAGDEVRLTSVNGDQVIQYPSECLTSQPGIVAGGMQMAEQILTGETGRDPSGQPTGDRDQDCVPELAHARIGSVLAAQVHFHSP